MNRSTSFPYIRLLTYQLFHVNPVTCALDINLFPVYIVYFEVIYFSLGFKSQLCYDHCGLMRLYYDRYNQQSQSDAVKIGIAKIEICCCIRILKP